MVYERSKVNQIMEQKSLHADSKELEKEHVHDVYKHIAVHFSETRYKPWPRVAQFLQQQPNGSLIADVGRNFFK